MRKTLVKAGITLLTAFTLNSSAIAQVLQLPTRANNVWLTSATPIKGLNTASMDIPLGIVGSAPTGFGQLVACAYLDGGNGAVSVKDMISGNVVTIPYPAISTSPIMVGVPDVILGNVPGSSFPILSRVPGKQFTMAVGYVGIKTGVRAVYIDFFDIVYTTYGTGGTFTVTYAGTQDQKLDFFPDYFMTNTIPGVPRCGGMRWEPLETVHMDVVADPYAPPLPYGSPRCDHFFAAYDAWHMGNACCMSCTTNDYESWIFMSYGGDPDPNFPARPVGGLSLYRANMHQFIANTDYGYQPDVAGVRYDTLIDIGTPVAPNLVPITLDMARLVYSNTVTNPTNPPWNAINRVNWYPALAWPGNPPSYYSPDYRFDQVTNDHVLHLTHPRIDADDDNHTNNGHTSDSWKVVYEVDSTVAPGVHKTASTGDISVAIPALIYNSSNINLPATGVLPNYYDHYLPAVAYSGYKNIPAVANKHYLMTTATDVPLSGQYLTMQPIERNQPLFIADDPSSAKSYFLMDTLAEDMISCQYANSVSTPSNKITDTSIVAWAAYDAGAGNYKIYYKNDKYAPASPNGYNYRTAQPDAVAAVEGNGAIKVFPNPAETLLNITLPAGTKTIRYTIANMVGQQIATGQLEKGNNTVNVAMLLPGNYSITLHEHGKEQGSYVFVKK